MGNNLEMCRRGRAFPGFLRNKIEEGEARRKFLEWRRLGLDGISTIATEGDIEQRIIYQITRCLKLQQKNQLTPEWKSFGANHCRK